MRPQLRRGPFAAAVETGAGLHPDGVGGEGPQALQGLLGGQAFGQLRDREDAMRRAQASGQGPICTLYPTSRD